MGTVIRRYQADIRYFEREDEDSSFFTCTR